ALPRGSRLGSAVPAVPADRRLGQGMVVCLPAGVGQPAQDQGLRGVADRGTERAADALQPRHHRRRRPALRARPEAGLRPREIQGWPDRTKGSKIGWKDMYLREILMERQAW